MPLTLFHFALATPAKAVLGRTFNTTAFLAANAMIDMPIVVSALTTGDVLHTPERWHDLAAAGGIALFLWALLFRSWAGAIGAALGTISHIFLDALIYPEMPLLGAPLAGVNHMVEIGCVLLGTLGAWVLWHRHPGWWQTVGLFDVMKGMLAELRWGNRLTVPIGAILLIGLVIRALP